MALTSTRRLRSVASLLLTCFSCVHVSVAWQFLHPLDRALGIQERLADSSVTSRRVWLQQSTAGLLTVPWILLYPSCNARAEEESDFESDWIKSLQPATENRPPITIGRSSGSLGSPGAPRVPPPTQVAALISLANPQLRPSPGDTLVIRVFDGPSRQRLLGGAKISVARIRFPIQVLLDDRNAVSSAEAWKEAASSQDLWMVASICPADAEPGGSSSTACSDDSNGVAYSFQASGISKFLTSLPGLDSKSLESLGSPGVRPPASLTLKMAKNTH